jgi:hypothetical protein
MYVHIMFVHFNQFSHSSYYYSGPAKMYTDYPPNHLISDIWVVYIGTDS